VPIVIAAVLLNVMVFVAAAVTVHAVNVVDEVSMMIALRSVQFVPSPLAGGEPSA